MIRCSPVLLALLVATGCTGEADPVASPEDTTTPSASGATYEVDKGAYHAGDDPQDEQPGDVFEEVDSSSDAPRVSSPEAAPRIDAPTSGDIVDRDDHVDFALDFLGRQAYNSVGGLMDLYGGQVRYFDQGVVSQATVAEDKSNYFERWPNRYYEVAGPVRASRGENPTIRFDYTYAVSHADGSGEREGRAWSELVLSPADDGYVITGERGGTY